MKTSSGSEMTVFLTEVSSDASTNLSQELKALEQVSSAESKEDFLAELGLHRWSFWFQEMGGKNVCIHCFEGRKVASFDEILKAFQKLLKNKNPYAITVQRFFPKLLLATHKIEKVLKLEFYNNENLPSAIYPLCYALPLLPNHLENHREYCRQAMHEKKKETSQACRAFGMINLNKWIQKGSTENYVLYYQAMSSPVEEGRKQFLSLENNPKAQEATRTLREQTGLKFAELWPLVDCVYVLE